MLIVLHSFNNKKRQIELYEDYINDLKNEKKT